MQIYSPARSGASCAFCTICINNRKYKPRYDNYADKPMLLGKGREDEIRVRNRQKPELRLRPLRHAPSPHAPLADGDLRLNHLISGTLWVLRRIRKLTSRAF